MDAKKRQKYTIEFKLKVVKYAKEKGNCAAARKFGNPPTDKMVYYWRQQEGKLKQAEIGKHSLKTKQPKWLELENELKEWILEQRNNGKDVLAKTIMCEAKVRAAAKGNDDFRGDVSWCYRFMKRNSLTKKMPDQYKKYMIEFPEYVLNARKEKNIELGQIGNMDEVSLTFDIPSNKSVDLKGSKSTTIKTTGNEKSQYTAVLSCCADGTKLPPMLIFKGKSMPKDIVPPGIFIHFHEKGWMDEGGVKIWLEKIWSQRPGALLKKPSLLVWDQCSAHLTGPTKRRVQQLNSKLVVIPFELTCRYQPLDVSINRSFKSLMHKEWNKWMMAPHDKIPTEHMKSPSVAQVSQWVKNAWDAVNTETVIKSFKICGVSNSLVGTEDDMLCDYSTNESESEDNPEECDAEGDCGIKWEIEDEIFTLKENFKCYSHIHSGQKNPIPGVTNQSIFDNNILKTCQDDNNPRGVIGLNVKEKDSLNGDVNVKEEDSLNGDLNVKEEDYLNEIIKEEHDVDYYECYE